MIWFTSDTHFGHDAIVRYEKRPPGWEEKFLKYCEANIKPGDIVYHLGDFALGKDWSANYFHRIPGQKFLIRGNHDDKRVERLLWVWQGDYKEIKVDGDKIVLFHYPIARWNRAHQGSYHLHGHCHGAYTPTGRSYDVGIDHTGGVPVAWWQLKPALDHATPIYHHAGMESRHDD